ncbi:hypothetical protein PQX77_005059 [Marasmius sp. AFHP31]|nr:hypothetical protein PQX77_005059 [Marasmius sp. AFHP31]
MPLQHWLRSAPKDSGHGGQTEDLDGDEIDGFDEVIFPSDYKQKGHIVDDVSPNCPLSLGSLSISIACIGPAQYNGQTASSGMPTNCIIRCETSSNQIFCVGIFIAVASTPQSCHSGTVLDLPYVYTPSGRKKGIHVSSRALQRKASRADVISWSGCKDDQKSTDTFQGGQPVGAMSYAFINTLKKNPNQSYNFLLKSLKGLLFERFNQTPQIGSSHHIDTSLKFVI